MDYKENRSRFIAKSKGMQFKNAIEQIDEYILDPTVRGNEANFFIYQRNRWKINDSISYLFSETQA